MKDKKIFDILENAENDSMERLIDKCPEISDEQLDRIYMRSEKKFREQWAEENRTMRENNIKITEGGAAAVAEHSKRPAWLAPLSMAASILLIAGITIGSTIMLHRSGKPGTDGGPAPAVTVVTSTGTGTTNISTDKNGSAVTTTVTAVVSGKNGAQSADGEHTEETDDTEFIKPFVGQWKYQESSTNNIDEADTIENKGTVQINGDATYTFTDNSGNVSTGTIKKIIENIGGTDILRLDFSGDQFKLNGAYYIESRPYELHFGNGYSSRLLRSEYEDTYGATAGYKTAYRRVLNEFMDSEDYCDDSRWDLQDIDNDGTPELLISRAMFHVAGVRVYYYENGSALPVRYTNGDSYEYGVYGSMQICPEEGLVGVSNIHMGYEYSDTCKYENHCITQIQIIGNNENNRGYEEVEYSIDHNAVSKDEYDKAASARAAKNWRLVGQQYTFIDFSALD